MRAILWTMLAMLSMAACTSDSLTEPPVSTTYPIEPVAVPSMEESATGAVSVKTTTPEVTPMPAGLHAPQLNNTIWLNTQPLTPDQLNGQVVLVDFWTFDCINCVRTIPAVRELYRQYRDQGLIIIGVHSPEFQYEHDVNNVKDAITRLDVPYPVTLDNDFATWNAFGNHYWPSLYLIDKQGVIRYNHIGELHQNTTDWMEVTGLIERLLKE